MPPSVNQLYATMDAALAREGSGQTYLAQGWLPLSINDGCLSVVIAHDLTPDMQSDIRSHYAVHELSTTRVSQWQLRELAVLVFADRVALDASHRLSTTNPRLSARHVLTRNQQGIVAAGCALIVVGLLWNWVITLSTLYLALAAFYAAGILFKFVVSMRGATYDVVTRTSERALAKLTDAELPVYSVLVPVFREANIVSKLVDNLGRLDYPADKLEVIILTEAEDQETRDAVALSDPPANFHVVTVPAGAPQTKPRACNVGLDLATGEFLVIFDAEDQPDPDQLKRAVLAFRAGGEQLVCVQAALNYFNAAENVLTRMFALEYSYWFDYMLSGLEVSGLPIPLGGTSNHFRTAALRQLGGWDPFNVTEDADLGIRAAQLGTTVGIIDSTTMEEANTSVPNFIRQRSRWIKGYMQTTLVHARHPLHLIRTIGVRRFCAFVLLIAGTPLTFLGVIPLYALTLWTIIVAQGANVPFIPAWSAAPCLALFVFGNWITVYLSMLGPYKRGTFKLSLWSLLTPVYWILHSIAAYKALWQLIFKPHYWEKTEHGLTAETA